MTSIQGLCGGLLVIGNYSVRKNEATGADAKKCYTISVKSYAGAEATVTMSEKEFRQLISLLDTR